MAANVGVIYYEVEARTAKLLDSIMPADTSVDRLGKTFSRTDKAAKEASFTMTKTATAVKSMGDVGNEAANSMSRLVKLLGGLIAVQGVGGIITMAESYNEMAERVSMATRSTEEYELVQQRLLATANGTYRALSEAQEVFIGTSDNLRDLGYTLSQSLDITDSLSYSFVRNATATDRAQSALRAYDLALNKGKVDAIGWYTINGAIPSIVNDIAAATGKTSQEIRQMGAEGKITAQMMNEGLLQSLESNKKAADGMAVTVADAFTNLRTNLSVFIGEANRASSATKLISSAVVGLGENIEIIAKGFGIVGAGALSLYIARSGGAAMASMATALAARKSAAAALQDAQAKHASALAALAAAQANAALGTNLAALAAAQVAVKETQDALTAAQIRAKAAGAGLLGLLGGPAGIVALLASAGAAFYMFSDGADKARATLEDMDKPLEEVIAKFKKMNNAQREAFIIKHTEALAQATDDARDKFEELAKSISDLKYSFDSEWTVAQWTALQRELREAQRNGEDLTPILKRAGQESGVSPDVINTWLLLSGEIADTEKKANAAATRVGALKNEQHNLAGSARDAASGQRELNAALAGFDGASGDALKRMQERVASLQDGNSEVKKAARYLATLTDVSEEFKTAYMSAALAADHLTEANKRNTDASKAGNKAAEEEKRSREQNTKTLQDMAQELAFAALKGEELAVAKANAKLNSFATPEQIAEVQRLASELYKVSELQKLQQKIGDDPSKYIRGNDEPLSGGAFDDQTARYDAEGKREQERYEAQLVRLRESLEAKSITMEQYHAEFELAQKNHNDRLNQIDEARSSVMLSTASSAFGEMASLLKRSEGEQSGAYKAMFAASKAFAIADAGIKLNTAIMQAMAAPDALTPAQKFANYAAIATAGAGLISNISGASYGGGRQYGGSTQPGKMYRINENGAPEVWNAANGQQFMMANSRGKVISNKDATGSGGPNVYINNYGGAQVEQRMSNGDIIVEIDKRLSEKMPSMMAAEAARPNSQFRKSMGQHTDMRPRR